MRDVLLPSILSLVMLACAGEAAPPDSAARVSLLVAGLTLPSADEVCFDVRVANGAATVWMRGNPAVTHLGADQSAAPGTAPTTTPDDGVICSSDYGNARGDVAYVGTCDASADSRPLIPGIQNDVTLWVDGVYRLGAELGDWQDPCPDGCTIAVDCEPNRDSLARFDVTIARDAQQGFFDVAVDFGDFFCSAKLDTCYPGEPPLPIELLSDDTGARVWTAVLGLACSGGTGADTELLYGSIAVTCDSGDVFVIDPTGLGNQRVTSTTDAHHALHYAVYRGVEALDCGLGLASCGKLYWNVGFDLEDLAALNSTCVLALGATGHDLAEATPGFVAGRPTAIGLAYPYIEVLATLTTAGASSAVIPCQRNRLDDDSDVVATTYEGNIDGVEPPTVMCWRYDGDTVAATGATLADCPPAPLPCDPDALPFGGGSGTLADPSRVCSRVHLENVQGAPGQSFVQTVDLDLGAVTYASSVVATLVGHYDGHGRHIRNLHIDGTSTNLVGLFGQVTSGSEVLDLTLDGVAIVGGSNVGALAGEVVTGGKVTGCRAESGSVQARTSTVGGLVGANRGDITRSMAAVAVTLDSGDGAGGLAGRHQCNRCSQVCTITDSYATGSVTSNGPGAFDTGGLVGRVQGGPISRCFATGDVRSKTHNTAGLAGRLNGLVEDSYFLGTITHVGPGNVYNFGGAFGQANNVAGECNGGSGQRIYSAATNVTASSCTTPGGGCPTCTSITGAFAGQLANGVTFGNWYYWKEAQNPGSVFANALSPSCWTPGGGAHPSTCTADTGTCSADVVGLGDMTVQSSYAGLDFSATGVWRMPLVNPLARVPPGASAPLLSPVLAWQCGVDGVVCAP